MSLDELAKRILRSACGILVEEVTIAHQCDTVNSRAPAVRRLLAEFCPISPRRGARRQGMKTDGELLRLFTASGNQEAFAELVRQHVDLVYSAALRQVGRDEHLARDVAQIVFVSLARKAAGLVDRASVAGWLYTSTHYAAANTVRAERRRRAREQESHMIHESRFENSAAIDWDRLRPVLDGAMLELGELEREIVVQRFFAGRSFADIGAAMKISEDTARKRAARALDKLHALLGRRGILSTSGALALALSAHGISAAPAGLAATLSAAGLSSAALPAVAVSVAPILSMSKMTVAIASSAVALMGAAWVYQRTEASVVRAEVASLRDARARLNAETAGLRQRMTQTPARAAKFSTEVAGNAAAIPPSGMTSRWGSPAQIRAGLDASYAPLFRRLKLAPTQVEGLRELLAQRKRATFYIYDLLAAEQMTMADLASHERRELERVATQPIDEQIKEFLDPADFEYFESFERTLQLRSMFTFLAVQLRNTIEPLRDEQIDRLVSWTEAAFPSPDRMQDHGLPTLWKQVIGGAATILSPAQLERFAQYERAMASWQRIIEINRSAEAKGLIKASSHSRAP